jgi:hypothetical protein
MLLAQAVVQFFCEVPGSFRTAHAMCAYSSLTPMYVPCRDVSGAFCKASAASSDLLGEDSSSKVARILSFVEQHSPVPVAADSLRMDEDAMHFQTQPCWHHSYDEEAADGSGSECDEEAMSLASDRQMLVRAAQARREAVAHPADAHPMAQLQSALIHARLATAAPLLASPENTWAYGSTAEAKPWFYSYDEEAEGSFEEAYASSSCSSELSLQAYLTAQANKRAVHEARHAAKATRRSRRAALRASLGDLERMDAWVEPQSTSSSRAAAADAGRRQQQRRASAPGYASLLPLAAEAVLKQLHASDRLPEARRPQNWQFTWDEEAHGGMGDSILGSC